MASEDIGIIQKVKSPDDGSKTYNLRQPSATKKHSRYLDFELSPIVSPARKAARSTDTNQTRNVQCSSKAKRNLINQVKTEAENPTRKSPKSSKTVTSATSSVSSRSASKSKTRQPERPQLSAVLPRLLSEGSGGGSGSSSSARSHKDNLIRLRNLLKLPKARRWLFCEFFYPDIDRELFLSENDFSQCLREAFPNLRTRLLRRIEWRAVRHLIGKPRRCSCSFFAEERAVLEKKRQKIRDLYRGVTTAFEPGDELEIPQRIPEMLSIGATVMARVRSSLRDGIFLGTVSAVLDTRYRIQFDKDIVPPQVVSDEDVASVNPPEPILVTSFLDRNRIAQNATQAFQAGNFSAARYYLQAATGRSVLSFDPSLHPTSSADPEAYMHEDDRNFVELVQHYTDKLLKVKRTLVDQLEDMNTEAERLTIFSDSYPGEFQRRYAKIVLEMDHCNKLMEQCLTGISEHSARLLPDLSDVSVATRPDALRKLTCTHALQLVKHCNLKFGVKSRRTVDLIANLVALLLQAKNLAGQLVSASEMSAMQESLAEIGRSLMAPDSLQVFQDHVEMNLMEFMSGSGLQEVSSGLMKSGTIKIE